MTSSESLEKASKARMYSTKLNQISELIFDIALNKSTQSLMELHKVISELPEILSFCELSNEEIELVYETLEAFIVNPISVTASELKQVQEIIFQCKIALQKFVEEQILSMLDDKEKLEEYLSEFEKLLFKDKHNKRRGG